MSIPITQSDLNRSILVDLELEKNIEVTLAIETFGNSSACLRLLIVTALGVYVVRSNLILDRRI
jgi:hypothetical protein